MVEVSKVKLDKIKSEQDMVDAFDSIEGENYLRSRFRSLGRAIAVNRKKESKIEVENTDAVVKEDA